ncbi:MAG TPA: hypothetical protein VHK91_17490 [Flavisolibacter sp.]|jgi:hypothetical protein|nr:hypothetical protein [Flavisolibacter sp.]
MFQPTLEQDLDLWEAWIEFDHLSTESFGTLHIWGEITAGRREKPYVVKTASGNGELRLEVVSAPALPHSRIAEVHFSEPVQNIGNYNTVVIYRGNQLLACIVDIEVVV